MRREIKSAIEMLASIALALHMRGEGTDKITRDLVKISRLFEALDAKLSKRA